MESYTITKTITNKTKNEDFFIQVKNTTLRCNGFILGDGIGSHYLPDEGSKFCVEALKKLIEECTLIENLNFDLLYSKVYESIKLKFDTPEENTKAINPKESYGTTLICVLEFQDEFIMAYLGNGSIWHLRGDFTNFSKQRYLPWNAINLLNPHTVEENGKEALYKFIALEASGNQIKPSVIKIQKDNDYFGDLIIASTDGLHSNDQIPVAKDREGNIWISGEKKMELLFELLKKTTQTTHLAIDDLEKGLDDFLEDIESRKIIDDDTTIGLIISEKALSYQKSINESNSSK
jgi:serine/threonine protein phosphatase PrpC